MPRRLLLAEGPAQAELQAGTQAETETEAEADPGRVTCWDGTVAPTRGACDRLAGPEGLTWVFPSFDPGDPDCRDRTGETAWAQSWECRAEVDGAEVYLTYRQFASVAEGRGHLDQDYGTPATAGDAAGTPGHLVWDRPVAEHHSRTVMYAGAPFAVTIWAFDRDQVDRTLAELVELSPAAEVSRQPV